MIPSEPNKPMVPESDVAQPTPTDEDLKNIAAQAEEEQAKEDPYTLMGGDPEPTIQPTEEMKQAGLGSFIRSLGGQIRPPSVAGGAARATEEETTRVSERFMTGKVVDPARTSNRNFSLKYIGDANDFDEELHRVMDVVAEERRFGEEDEMAPRSHVKTIRAAREERVNVEQFLGRKLRGGPRNADELTAWRIMLTEGAYELKEMAHSVVDQNGKRLPTATDEQYYDFRQALNTYAAMQMKVQGAVKEIGRMLNAMQIPVGTDPLGGTNMADILTRQGGGHENIEKAAAAIFQAKTPEEIAALTRGSWSQRYGGALYEFWINGLLSGFGTHVKNVVGNSITATMTIPEHYLAAGIGKARLFMNPEGEMNITNMENTARLMGFFNGMYDGGRIAFHNFWESDGSPATMEGVDGSKLDYFRKPAFTAENLGFNEEGFLGKGLDLFGHWYVRLPGRVLQAEDDFFKGVGYRMELSAQATLKTLQEGIEPGTAAFDARRNEILLDPTMELHKVSSDFAHYQTFTNMLEGKVGHSITTLQDTPAGRVFVPFLRTPVNILKYAGSRSPFAPLFPSWIQDVKAGGRKADLAIGRMVLGTSMAATFATLKTYDSEGNYRPRVTGSPPRDPATAELWREYGITPYSIWDEDDQQYKPYNWAEPFGMQLAVMADFVTLLNHTQDPQMKEEVMAAYVASVATYTTDKSYIQGFSQFMDIINHGEMGAMLRLPSTLVPTWLANIRKDTDDVVRETRFATPAWETDPDDKLDRALAGNIGRMLAYFKNRTPGFSTDLQPRTDVWGEILYVGDPIWGWHSISPAVGHGVHYEPATVHLINNGISGREVTPVISVPTEFGPVKVDLMQVEDGERKFFELRQLVGRNRRSVVKEVIKTKDFTEAGAPGEPNEIRAMALDTAMSAGRTAGMGKFMEKYLTELQKIAVDQYRRRQEPKGSQLPGLEVAP